MGLITLDELQSDLRDASGRPTIDTGRLNRIINNAQFEFGYAFKFPELNGEGTIATVQGQSSYTLPADFRAMTDNGVRIATPQDRFGGILEPETRTNFFRSADYPSVASQGAVGAYHLFAKKLWVRPTPDSVASSITFDYWKRITRLVSSSDVTIFQDDWDDILFRGALYRIHMIYGEHDRMVNIFNMYLSMVRSRVMAEDLEEFPEGGISYIQDQFDNLRR